ncbi:MAG TPA: hypothetical protein VH274_01840 [Mycobacteriales bacterium]|jgi:hypothetical protein|nr:hypothetical protein [Mycobacteriales bacterium]
MVKPSTLSLFETEMHDQLAAARDALTEAERRGESLLIHAAAAHLEGLVDLARRNGILDAVVQPLAAPAT